MNTSVLTPLLACEHLPPFVGWRLNVQTQTLQIQRAVKGFKVSCRPLQWCLLRRCARTTLNSQQPQPRCLPPLTPCAYPPTAGFSAHVSPLPHRAGLRVRDDLRVWPWDWALFCPTSRAANGGVRLAADGRRRRAHGRAPRKRWRPASVASWATADHGTPPCVVCVVCTRQEAAGPRCGYHKVSAKPLSIL